MLKGISFLVSFELSLLHEQKDVGNTDRFNGIGPVGVNSVTDQPHQNCI